MSEEKLVEKLRQRLRDKNTPRICSVGDSHSHYISKFTLPLLNLTELVPQHIATSFPNPDKIIELLSEFEKCDVYFTHVAQWPASWYAGKSPFSFGKYYEKVKQHVENILKFNPNATVYLPTAEQCPLMWKINQCKDWRAPTLMDGYSHVLQMIEKDLNTPQVKYIDTNFIIYTHWDGAPDWQHLPEVVRTRKAIYLLSVLLGETKWFE